MPHVPLEEGWKRKRNTAPLGFNSCPLNSRHPSLSPAEPPGMGHRRDKENTSPNGFNRWPWNTCGYIPHCNPRHPDTRGASLGGGRVKGNHCPPCPCPAAQGEGQSWESSFFLLILPPAGGTKPFPPGLATAWAVPSFPAQGREHRDGSTGTRAQGWEHRDGSTGMLPERSQHRGLAPAGLGGGTRGCGG